MVGWFKALDRVLKGEATRPESLRNGTIELPIRGLVVVVLLLGAVYGACMGSFALTARWDTSTRSTGFLQMLASAAKVPLLFFLTLAVTFPSLYVFNALVGSRLAFATVTRLLLAAVAVTMAVLASFGTIVVFFSLCTTSYPFMVLLNVAMFAAAGLLGMRFLLQTLQRLSAVFAWEPTRQLVHPDAPAAPVVTAAPVVPPGEGEGVPPEFGAGATTAAPPPPLYPQQAGGPRSPGALEQLEGQVFGPRVKTVFRIWIVVFGLVGAQMGWVLRPFIGSPTTPFTFFRERESNFFEAVLDEVVQVAAGDSSKRRPAGWRGDNGRPQGTNGAYPPVTQRQDGR